MKSRSRIDPPAYLVDLRRAIALFLPARGLPLIEAGRRWSDRLLAIGLILWVWSAGTSLLERFSDARQALAAMYPSRRRPGTSLAGFMAAMARRSEGLLQRMVPTVRQRMEEQFAACRYVGRHLAFGFDATKIDCPRTRANLDAFKVGGKRKSAPQMLLGTLLHLGTSLPWAWRQGTACVPERTLLRELLPELPRGSLLVTDAGLMGYELLAAILSGGRSVLMRVGANVTLIRKLGYVVREHQGVVYLWTRRAREQGLPPLILRQIVLHDGRNRRMCLLTDVLSGKALTAAEARLLYKKRWGLELMHRSIKQTLCRRKMLSDSPEHARCELDWSMVGLWLLGLLLLKERGPESSVHEGVAGALRLVRGAMTGGLDARRRLGRGFRNLIPDGYRRTHPKAAHDWPRKKRETPCGLPIVRTATCEELLVAKALRFKSQAESLTA